MNFQFRMFSTLAISSVLNLTPCNVSLGWSQFVRRRSLNRSYKTMFMSFNSLYSSALATAHTPHNRYPSVHGQIKSVKWMAPYICKCWAVLRYIVDRWNVNNKCFSKSKYFFAGSRRSQVVFHVSLYGGVKRILEKKTLMNSSVKLPSSIAIRRSLLLNRRPCDIVQTLNGWTLRVRMMLQFGNLLSLVRARVHRV